MFLDKFEPYESHPVRIARNDIHVVPSKVQGLIDTDDLRVFRYVHNGGCPMEDGECFQALRIVEAVFEMLLMIGTRARELRWRFIWLNKRDSFAL